MQFDLNLSGDLFVREVRDVGAVFGVLDGDAANVALLVQIQERVLIQIFGFSNVGGTELDIQRVGILKVFNFGIVNLR